MSVTSAIQLTRQSKYKLNNGKSIPVTGFGTYEIPASETASLVYKALEAGYRHIDSAVGYRNQAQSAEGIASFLKDHSTISRDDIWFTTKITESDQGYEETRLAVKKISQDVKKYLDYVDLILIHSPLTNKDKRLGTWKALQEFTHPNDTIVVKSIGVSNYGIHHLEELLNWSHLTVKPVINQLELHPWSPKLKLREYLVKKGICIEAYSPLTQGKKLNDSELLKLESEFGISKIEILLKWSYLQGFIVLVKSDKPERIISNLNYLPQGNDGSDSEIPLQFGKIDLDYDIIDTLNKPESDEVLTWGGQDPTKYEG